MKIKTIRAAVAAALTIVAGVLTANADGTKRPMALMVMFDGLRADGIESGSMPNVMALRNGTWQTGYNGAWSVTGLITPGTDSVSAPNHVSIATGFTPSKHGVDANGKTASGNYATYPTWLKRVVDAKSGTSALFVYSWSEDGSLGPADGVTFLGNSDAQNATDLAALLASADAPDATMYFIDAVDSAGHAGYYYPFSSGYTNALAVTDGYLGACLSAIANRPTFADEDWLILVTSDHGGYQKSHGNSASGTHGVTVPIVIAGRSVTSGRIPGCPYNFDVTASALAHFGVTVEGLEATRRDTSTIVDAERPLSAGLAAYLPFDEDYDNKINDGITSQTNGAPALTAGGQVGGYCDIPSGSYLRLQGSQSLTYEGDNKSYTVIVWVKMNQVASGDPVILANKPWSGGGPAVGTLLCAGKLLYNYRGVTLNSGSGNERLDIGPYHVEGNTKWTFYAISRRDDGTHIIYQGRSDGTLNWNALTFDAFVLKSAYPFCIGQDGTGNYGSKFVGGVDDVALWTRALRHEDICRIYESGLDGIALGDLIAASPATATWTGAGTNPADLNDPANWSCTDAESNPVANAVPSWTTDVIVSGATTFDLTGGKSIACKSILFNDVTFSADKDWRGLDVSKIVNGSRIDLRGNKLTLLGFSGANNAANVCTITDSTTDTDNPGILEIETTSGVTFENQAIAMSENLRLVKSGAGTMTVAVPTQAYTGGTLISAGTLKLGAAGTSDSDTKRPLGSPVSRIEVAQGAVFDAFGNNFNTYHLVLAGGKLHNTPNSQTSSNTVKMRDLTLKANSEIVFYNQTGNRSHDYFIDDNVVWDLGGYTLTVTYQGKDPDFEFYRQNNRDRAYADGHLTLKNGTVKTTVSNTGWWHDHNTDGTEGGSYDIGLPLRHYGQSTVSNLTFRTTGGKTIVGGNPTKALYHVYGTFTPMSSYFHNVEMLNASTIDLSMKTGAWSTKCTYNGADYLVTFATNAAVTVNLTGRETEMESLAKGEVEGNERGYVITWQSANKPTNVTFLPKMANAEKYMLMPTDTGLRIRKTKGLVIIVK